MEPTAVAQPTTPSGNATEKMLIGLIAGLIVGGGGGWYLGNMMGLNQGAQATEAALAQQDQLRGSADTSAEVTSTAQNPLEDVSANPYEDVKVNPFE